MVKINQLSSPLFGGSGSGGGKIKQVILLSITTAPSGTFAKGSQYYNSSTKKIYTAVVANSWNDAKVEDPQFGVIYLFDNQGTTEYYQWDGDNLITTDLENYEQLVNKATNFNTINDTKYPTTKAVADYVSTKSFVKNFTDAGITQTSGTMAQLAQDIQSKHLETGTIVYGEITCSDMPFQGNAEVRVEVLETKGAPNYYQVLEFTLFSTTNAPYQWSFMYYEPQFTTWTWVPRAVPTNDYTSDSTNTVPSSKALRDGLASVTGAHLYDIKLLSQAIADKGWACMCHNTRKNLSKDDVPTLYNDILDKFNNSPEALSPSTDFIYDSTHNKGGIVYSENGYVYWGTNAYVNRCPANDIRNETVEQVYHTWSVRTFYIGKYIDIYRVYDNPKNIRIVNKSNNTYYDTPFVPQSDVPYIFSTQENGKDYIYCLIYTATNPVTYTILRIEDKPYDTIDSTTYDLFMLNRGIYQIAYFNNKYWFTADYVGDYNLTRTRLLTVENINDISDVSKWVLKTPSNTDNVGNFDYIIGETETIVVTQTNISYDGGETFSSFRPFGSGGANDPVIIFDNNPNKIYLRKGSNDPNNLYTMTYENGTTTITYTTLSSSASGVLMVYDKGNFFVSFNRVDLCYASMSKIINTDTYQINGNSVTINYVQYNDWKICTPDVSNDTNLNTVYSYLGYLNYWRLDRTVGSETVSLPRNSNLWTMMYVGDDYQDSNLPSGSFAGIATKENLRTKWFSSCTISNTSSTSATDVAVDTIKFTSQQSTDGTYTFSYDGTNWSLSGNTVSLSDYGISFTGTATSGDTIVVVLASIAGSTLATGINEINIVLKNGVELRPSVDYRVSSGTITFTTSLLITDEIGVR